MSKKQEKTYEKKVETDANGAKNQSPQKVEFDISLRYFLVDLKQTFLHSSILGENMDLLELGSFQHGDPKLCPFIVISLSNFYQTNLDEF
jgi:hypothetical protein